MSNSFFYTDKLALGYDSKILINNINIAAEKGKITTVIGPNGVGKSTLLKSISGIIENIGGEIYINGNKLSIISKNELAKTVSVLMTERIRGELLCCEDIVKSGRYPYTGQLGILSEYDRKKIGEAMALTGIDKISERDFSCISDGQKQLVMLARAICQEPDLLILDEPTTFLDIHYKSKLLNILKKLVNEKNIAVIMTMHEIDIAQKISDYVICISKDGIDKCGSCDEIFDGEYISRLYNMSGGNYNKYSCGIELEPVKGKPEIFVIGGGGKGTTVFRSLQKMNIPFGTGVIHKNDIDFPAAEILASVLIEEKEFEPVSETALKKAMKVIDGCRKVICCVDYFGTMNKGNKILVDYAKKKNIEFIVK